MKGGFIAVAVIFFALNVNANAGFFSIFSQKKDPKEVTNDKNLLEQDGIDEITEAKSKSLPKKEPVKIISDEEYVPDDSGVSTSYKKFDLGEDELAVPSEQYEQSGARNFTNDYSPVKVSKKPIRSFSEADDVPPAPLKKDSREPEEEVNKQEKREISDSVVINSNSKPSRNENIKIKDPIPVKKMNGSVYYTYLAKDGDNLESASEFFTSSSDEFSKTVNVKDVIPGTKYGVPVLVHHVDKAENLGYISKKYNVRLKNLQEMNPDLNDKIFVGRMIYLPILDKRFCGFEKEAIDDALETDNEVVDQKKEISLIWPVRGVVILSSFRQNGVKNDGVVISTMDKENVVAAMSGKVTYVGNKVAGYDNMIIIKNEEGYSTIYAYNSEVVVKKDDVVKQGDLIARAGKNAVVNGGALYFSFRKDKNVLDPENYLK